MVFLLSLNILSSFQALAEPLDRVLLASEAFYPWQQYLCEYEHDGRVQRLRTAGIQLDQVQPEKRLEVTRFGYLEIIEDSGIYLMSNDRLTEGLLELSLFDTRSGEQRFLGEVSYFEKSALIFAHVMGEEMRISCEVSGGPSWMKNRILGNWLSTSVIMGQSPSPEDVKKITTR
jgi:hypothetical protein